MAELFLAAPVQGRDLVTLDRRASLVRTLSCVKTPGWGLMASPRGISLPLGRLHRRDESWLESWLVIGQ